MISTEEFLGWVWLLWAVMCSLCFWGKMLQEVQREKRIHILWTYNLGGLIGRRRQTLETGAMLAFEIVQKQLFKNFPSNIEYHRKSSFRVPWWLSRSRLQLCHCYGSGYCCCGDLFLAQTLPHAKGSAKKKKKKRERKASFFNDSQFPIKRKNWEVNARLSPPKKTFTLIRKHKNIWFHKIRTNLIWNEFARKKSYFPA